MLYAQDSLDTYIQSFNYESREEMKVSSEEILDLLLNGEAILLDIRFREEQEAWSMDYALKIPLNELRTRLNELPKNKRIITACAHKDRAIIAMIFLKTKGFESGYLKDGLLGLAEHLRGNKAKTFIRKLPIYNK